MDKQTILAALENPEAAPIVLEAIQEKGFKVFDDTKLKEFEAQERMRIDGGIRSEIYTALDKDVMSTTGLKKNSDEKTYDFIKRAFNSFKSEKEQFESKTKELEEKIKTGGADATLKAQYEAMQSEYTKAKEELSKKDQILFQKDVNIDLKEGLRDIKFNQSFPESVRNTFVNTVINSLNSQAKVDDKGKIVYVNEEGKVILNKDLEPADASFILKERLKDIIDTGKQQAGVGSQAIGGETGGAFSMPSTVKSQVQLTEYLHKKGIFQDSQEYRDIWKNYGTKLPLS